MKKTMTLTILTALVLGITGCAQNRVVASTSNPEVKSEHKHGACEKGHKCTEDCDSCDSKN